MPLWDDRGHRADARWRRFAGAVVAAATLGMASLAASAAPCAAAQAPLPSDNAGTGQYVEPVPAAGGDHPAARGHHSGRGLGARTRQALGQRPEGRLLERIATDPGAGAPSGPPGSSRSDRAAGDSAAPRRTAAAAAVTHAAVGDAGPAVPIVLAALVVLTAAAAAVALRRRRRT